ncbi:serine/arginine repetitive matrix protein 1 [Ursus arctos]|uniref:serine/arginine repetitive matrix protein 1 n=1 Tax=Ursus arctos TaxID=9644 RepID=UPI002546645E|nr:serine/arginine repetitive matrix protein 1 [Ursus arctos]
MSWDRMRYILWDNNCSVPPRIHMTPFTAAAAAAELPASGKARAQANGEPPRPGPRPSSSSSSTSSSAPTTPASASPPRLHNAQSAPLRAARRSASGGEGPAERAAPRPPRPPGPARAPAPPPLRRGRGRTTWPSGFRFSLRRFSFSPSLVYQEKRLTVGASASSSLRKRKYSACVSRRGVAPSPEPRSVHRLGTWLRIFLSFFPPADCSELGLKQSLERRGEKFASGLDFICTSQEDENPTERGWCKAAITEFRCVLSPLE